MSEVLHNVAFKEWAVTVESLLQGDLIFVLRKGGIVEETKHFELFSDAFYLMPAFEHQKEHLLKPKYQGKIPLTMSNWSPDATEMTLKGYAQVVEDILIQDVDKLYAISGEHIWTNDFAEERLKWKKTQPLHLIVLRVFKLDEEIQTPMHSSYKGCKSWVTIEDTVPKRRLIPVLTDEQFDLKYKSLLEKLA